jgi:two-component system NtrC family sensor kinase
MNPAFRIMVIEDSETQTFKLRCLLEEQGWQVSTAGTAEAALAVIGDSLPDLLLVDYNLPGMRGDEFSRRIRMNLSTRGIPILIQTSTALDTIEVQCLEKGADDYVSKSDGPEILLLRIRVLLYRSLARPILNPRDSDFRAARILAIDDSPAYLAFLAIELLNRGYVVETASSGAEGLSRLVNGGFDCILVDLIMPGMDGIELCRRIAAMSKSVTNDPAVFILTGSDNQVDMNRSLESGADDFVSKSKDLAVLLARIRALMRRRSFQEENGRIFEELNARSLDAVHAAHNRAVAPIPANRNPREVDGKVGITQAQFIRSTGITSPTRLAAEIACQVDDPLAFVVNHLSSVETTLDSLCAEMELHLCEVSLVELRGVMGRIAAMRQGLDLVKKLTLDPRAHSGLDKAVPSRLV